MNSMDIHEVLEYLPHRYPFLLIDRVLSCEPGKGIIAVKNVTINEPFFSGHFPHHPIMPGVLIIEAMAQTGAVLVVHTLGPSAEGKLVYFMSVESARFRRPVVPGVVLLDIGLPGLDGYEVARRLRAVPGSERLLLIALTGYGQESDRRRSIEAGFDHHLVKPLEFLLPFYDASFFHRTKMRIGRAGGLGCYSRYQKGLPRLLQPATSRRLGVAV